MRKARHVSVLFGLVIVWSGRCATASLDHKCLKLELGSGNCTGLELRKGAQSNVSDCISHGRVCKRYHFGRLIFIRKEEKTSETLTNVSSETLVPAASSPAVGELFNVHGLSSQKLIPASSSPAVGKPFSVQRPVCVIAGLVFVVPVSLFFSIYGLLVLRGWRRSSSQLQEQKCSCSGAGSPCSREMASETSDDVEEIKFVCNPDAKLLESTSACNIISMDAVFQTDSPLDKVDLAIPSMSCADDQNVVDPSMVASVVDCIGVPGREASSDKNVSNHSTESPHTFCDVARSYKTSECHDEVDQVAAQSDAQLATRNNLLADQVAVHSESRSATEQTLLVDTDMRVAAHSEVRSITKQNLLVDTDIRETSQFHLIEIPSPMRRRRPSASFESPSPVRRQVSDTFRSDSPVRSRAHDNYRNAIAEEVARNATAELFRQLLGDGAIAENINKQADEMTCLYDHSIASLGRQLPAAASSSNALVSPKETTTVDAKPSGTERKFKEDFDRQQSLTCALDLNPSEQFELTQTTSLVRSPGRRCSSSAAVIDASAFSPGAFGHKDPEAGSISRLKGLFNLEVEPHQAHALVSTPSNRTERVRKNSLDGSPAHSCASSSVVADASAFSPGASAYQEPETGSTRRLKDFFNVEVERSHSQAHALVATPSYQMTRTRKNSLDFSPAHSCSSSSWVADASAFSPGASEYQEPEAGSTHRLKDFFEKKLMNTGTPENPYGQPPTKKTIRASTLADAFAKRSSVGNSDYICEQKTCKTNSAKLLPENAD